MKRIKLMFLLLIVFFYQNLIAQKFSSKEKKETVENILNTIINSTSFDSIYVNKRTYFLTNELLTKESNLILKRNKSKVKILNKSELRKNKQYTVLSDFTLDWLKPTNVRVQLFVSPNKTLNFVLFKENEKWIIKEFVFFDD